MSNPVYSGFVILIAHCSFTVDKADWAHPLFDVYEDVGREKAGKDKDFTVGKCVRIRTSLSVSL